MLFFFSIYTSVSVQEDLLSIYLLCLLSDVVLQGISALRGTETKKKKKKKEQRRTPLGIQICRYTEDTYMPSEESGLQATLLVFVKCTAMPLVGLDATLSSPENPTMFQGLLTI